MTDEERLTVSVDEAAAMLGIARSSAYAGVKRGDIPSVKIGGRVLVPRKALCELLLAAGKDVPKELEP